jgi:hypothetical protein
MVYKVSSTQVNTRIKSLLKFDTNGALQNQLNHNQVLWQVKLSQMVKH